ncbi:MAG: EamA family transporter [Gudongella sp.]|nr:EamA family transporter [Gudongella sp.]
MNTNKKSYLEVHMAVFLFGLTGLFGKFIELSPFIIVLGRVFVAALFILLWLRLSKEPLRLNHNSDYKKLVFMGAILAIHWTTFFAAIQLSNVAIGILTFSTFPVFVSLFRPLIDNDKISKKEVVFGFITIIGILFIIPLKDVFSDTMAGSITGIFSGAVYAIFTIFNEKLVKTYSGKKVAFYEQAAATVFLLPSFFIIQPVVTTKDIILIILLGTLFTGVAHTMFINGLKQVSAYMASIITMLEPLYSIVLAYLLLGEKLNVNTLIGGIIILSTVVFISLDNLKRKTI